MQSVRRTVLARFGIGQVAPFALSAVTSLACRAATAQAPVVPPSAEGIA